jgi:beta-glucanase (GH16 family)
MSIIGDLKNMQNHLIVTIALSRSALKIATVAITIMTLALFLGVPTISHAQAPSGMGLVWQDEFEGASTGAQPNSAFWQYDTGAGGWGNSELEDYTTNATNAHMIYDGTGTDNQALQIEADLSGGTWYSARINTAGHVSFGPYGYYEARCKFPNAGDGYWPAFWFLGTNIGSVGWPNCGEIDVAEEIDGQWQNHQSLHMPNWDPTLVTTPNSSTTTYHNYGANWQPGYVTFYVDGQSTGTFTEGGGGTWEFDNQTMFMLLNCAVGGSFPGNPDGTTAGTGYFDVDYVHQYEQGAQTIPNGRYEIVASTTGNCLNCLGNGYTNGTGIGLYPDYGTPNELWQVTNLNNGYYSIQTINPNGSVGISLDCENSSGLNGTVLDLWTYWGGPGQQWSINPVGGGIWSIGTSGTNASGGHDVIDGENCSGATGTIMDLWTWDGGGCQQTWDFVPR